MSFIKNIKFLTIFFLFISCSNHNLSKEDLIGTWQGEYGGRDLIITFSEENFQMKIQNISKKSYDMLDGTYLINFQKKPIPLSLRDISNLNHPLHTVIFFENHETIIIKEFSPKWRLRTISFDDSENNFILKRLTT